MRRETRRDGRDKGTSTHPTLGRLISSRDRSARARPDLAREAPEGSLTRASAQGTMAAVEYNVYDEKTMSIMVNGEPGTDQAAQFLKDKLCEQGLKGASVPTSSTARTDSSLGISHAFLF